MNVPDLLLVAMGGGTGAAVRFAAGHALDRGFPAGTLLVNTVGSLLLGVLVGAGVGGGAAALLGTGFCGGLTTYSAFAVVTVARGPRGGTAYAAATLAGALVAVTLGYALGAALAPA